MWQLAWLNKLHTLASSSWIFQRLLNHSGYSHQKRLQIATFFYIVHACTTPTVLRISTHVLQEAVPRLFCRSSDCRHRLLASRGVTPDVWSDQHSLSACLHNPKYIPLLSMLHVAHTHRQLRLVGARPSWGPKADSFSTEVGVFNASAGVCNPVCVPSGDQLSSWCVFSNALLHCSGIFLGTSKQEMMFERVVVLWKQSPAREVEGRCKNNEVKKRLQNATIGVGV